MAFYRRASGTFIPSANCIGPWDAKTQHGGPPAGLLAGAAARFGEDAENFIVTRVTVDLLRPVGLVPLSVEVTPLRLGRQAQWFQAELRGEGRLLARATIVRIARAELNLPSATEPLAPPPGPEGQEDFEFSFFLTEEGYHRAVQLTIAEGTWGRGPCTAWMRMRMPLVEGESTLPIERVMVLADATNGVAPALSDFKHTFINADLTVHLSRPMQGEWLALAARSIPQPTGTGLVQSRLFDREGELGRCLESLVVRKRPG